MKDSSLVVAGLATLAAGTYAFRLSGQLLRARITFPPRATKLLEAAAVNTDSGSVVIYAGRSEPTILTRHYLEVILAATVGWRSARR